jgi:hypothetical protein
MLVNAEAIKNKRLRTRVLLETDTAQESRPMRKQAESRVRGIAVHETENKQGW